LTLRKGQNLFNQIAKKYELKSHVCHDENNITQYPYYNLHQILFYMTDAEFIEMMETYKIE